VVNVMMKDGELDVMGGQYPSRYHVTILILGVCINKC
jgi:hypothetical protein